MLSPYFARYFGKNINAQNLVAIADCVACFQTWDSTNLERMSQHLVSAVIHAVNDAAGEARSAGRQ